MRTIPIVIVLLSLACSTQDATEAKKATVKDHLQEFRRLSKLIQDGERSGPVLFDLAWLASYPETEQQVVGYLKDALTINIYDFELAGAYYNALMFSEQYKEAEEAAWGVFRAFCGADDENKCESDDGKYLRSMVLLLEADAANERMRKSLQPTEILQHIKPTILEAIRIADSIDPSYSPPDVLKYVWKSGEPASLNTRSFYIGALVSAGRKGEWLAMLREYFTMCPSFGAKGICYEAYDLTEALLEEHGLTFESANIPLPGTGFFNSASWKEADPDKRGNMAGDLVYSRVLLGQTKQDVISLLGDPDSSKGYTMLYYITRREDCDADTKENHDAAAARDWELCIELDKDEQGVLRVLWVGTLER